MARTADQQIPFLYRLFFLYIEPVATALGALYSFDFLGLQMQYMSMTHPLSAATALTVRESIILNQLANLYFVFAFNEALVLRATNDVSVWKVFLLGLLIADFGHLYSVHAMGSGIYWQAWTWSSMYWGNLGFVYVGASMRTAFLLGLGFAKGSGKKVKR
ncbi:hypothetical protein LTR86_007968 [Recurvomyces mirabilis]|nr:hypothetical protein LTR86_007968 [Recurvomyces mirabilis]